MEILFGIIFLIGSLICEEIQKRKADEYARKHIKRH